MSNPFNPFQTRSALRFPPEAQGGRLPPSPLCYCPSPQPLSLAERGGAHALSALADRASAVPLVLLPLSPTLASRQNCCRKPYRKDTGGTPCAILSGLFHRTPLGKTLLQKHEEDSEDQTHEGGEVVPMKGFPFEEEGDNQSEDDEGDNLLDNF